MNDFAEACIGSMRDRQLNDYSEIEETVTDALSNCVSSVMNPDATCAIEGAPDGWTPPGPPEKWSHKQDEKGGEPRFEEVDNPGSWSCFTFRGYKGKSKKYVHHRMPSGAVPVPKDPTTGKRTDGGYEFFY